ncbi:MAG: hypothetical protein ACKOWK_02730 [Micrococcales bacterium]
MSPQKEPRPGRTPSGYTIRYSDFKIGRRPSAIRFPPETDDEQRTPDTNVSKARDYNVVSMSDFKINPSLYMYWTKDHPLAVTRYGRIYAMVVSLPLYNTLLDRLNSTIATNIRLRHLLKTVNPALDKLLDEIPTPPPREKIKPYWPMMNQEPKHRFSTEITRAELLDALERIDALYELQRPEGLFPDPERDDPAEEELDPYDEM